MNPSPSRSRGRPSLGNVVYKRRVPPSFVPQLDALLSNTHFPDPIPPSATASPSAYSVTTTTAPAQDIQPLLDDIERLSQELATAKAHIPTSTDEISSYWKARALKAESRVRDLES